MDRIIRWHLKRARAAAAGFDPKAHAEVTPVLEDVALVLKREARRRGVTLEVAGNGAPDFHGDAEDLAEIVGNLAENAVKWARASVQIVAQSCSEGLVITVTDDGPGIPASAHAQLLARGARLDEGEPGHGLGLAIAADRVTAYGGRLTLGEAAHGGLIVTVTLPARS